jgi:hypothetical protein
MHSHIHEISDSNTPIIEVRHESAVALTEYARIAIAFEVNEVFDVATSLESQFTLTPRHLTVPYVKDYDAIESPADWSQRFDISKWAFFSAFAEGQRLGGATVACDTAGLDMLEGRTDVAVLWDIRVAAFTRRRGAVQRSCGLGLGQRVSRTQGRDPEHQRRRVPLLCAAGVRPADGSEGCVSGAGRRSSARVYKNLWRAIAG